VNPELLNYYDLTVETRLSNLIVSRGQIIFQTVSGGRMSQRRNFR